ncbi:MAG: hypothetical protein VYC47_05920 [Verrucomicrobiota bacterium]|nr:hypothetical protein [Verrucomicrobiota bacterium]
MRTINGKQVVTGRYANRIRIKDGSKGPARLGSGSSGRYSRNSDTQILGATGCIRSVEVTWPSGIKSVEPVTNPVQLLELGL